MYNITMILAKDINNLVGDSNGKFGLAWHYPEDLQFYKQNTINKINVMGRKTYDLIGRPLPNRTTYVLTRDENYRVANVKTINNIEQVLELSHDNEVMICGGVSIYQSFNQYANKIILTEINQSHHGDVYYDNLDLNNFEKTSEKQEGILTFTTWERNED